MLAFKTGRVPSKPNGMEVYAKLKLKLLTEFKLTLFDTVIKIILVDLLNPTYTRNKSYY